MTNEYTVNVDKRTYHITVEHNNNPSQNHTDFSEELSYETTKAEYDLLCDIIKKISDFSFPKDNVQLALLIIYSILLTLNVSLYVLTLIQLTHLLKGVAIQRFDPQIILKREMIDANSKAVAKYICSRYNQCIDTNKNILEKRFEKFNKCVNCMIPLIIISIFLMFISNFIL